MTKARWYGWHFMAEDGALRYGDKRTPKDGEVLEQDYPHKRDDGNTFKIPTLCESGMHASARLIDALKYTPGPILCRVELVGKRVDGDDKSAAVGRTILWRIDATDLLRRFAYWCADDQIHRLAPQYFRLAIDALRAIGDTKQAKLLTTRLEALEACKPIVDEKTRATAAEELSTAWSAARSAAWSAAESAAWSAAESAARSAAAAKSAAWSAAWSAQETKLLQMLAELRGTEDLNETS